MAAEVEIVGWKMNQPTPVGLPRDYHPSQNYNFPPWAAPPQYRRDPYFRMKRSSATADPPPQCALNPQDVALLGNSHRLGKDDKNYPFSPVNRGSGRNPHPMQRQTKREPQPVNQAWSNNTFENSNTSWEGDWSNASSTPPIKTEPSPSGYFNHHRTAGSFQSSSEWSPGESSASSSMAYGMMQSPTSNSSLSASSSSYYESNGFYGAGYGYGQGGGYMQQSPYGTAPQQQYHEPVRTFDGAVAAGSYNNNHRNPSSCPQALVKHPVPDYQRKQMRCAMDGVSKIQIKREPEDYNEVEGENFTSLFTKSLTSLYSQDTENTFQEENKPYEPDIMICSPLPLSGGMEEPSTYQRLNTTSSSQYNVNAVSDYQDTRSSFGFYESRNQNCEPPHLAASVVEELGADGDRMSSFRYDRPSFDDMHLYTSPANDSKGIAKKRKINMPNASPESGYPGSENRKKTPRLVPSYKSDSQWTPNSFAFSDIQIKQEPIDDYSTNEMDSQSCSGLPFKESSPSSNGNKSPGQQPDHPKQPPRKRSPAATCFDRFDKKSTPTNKKVSPLSVYAKVQENVVLSVKCRRYKKRTKPITSKEESICPGREEMELYKQNSLTPDQAAHQVMGELVERVSLFEERNVIDGPNLTQVGAMKVRELLMQFCHRYSLDYRDFEDIHSVLKPRIIIDNLAKNSERASAIRKRTSTSPVQTEVEPQPVKKTSSKAATAAKKASVEETKPAERRVLRSLPGRVDRWTSGGQEFAVGRRYSTRSGKDVSGENTQVDIIISSSTDSESEAGKEAEVRKKSQRLKKKSPAAVTPARSRTSSKASNAKSSEKVETRVCTRSRESSNASKTFDIPETNRINLRSRRDRIVRKDSTDSMRSSSVEILDITKSDRSSYDDTIDAVIAASLIDDSVKNSRRASKSATKTKGSQEIMDKCPSSQKKAAKNSVSKTSSFKTRVRSPSPELLKIKKEITEVIPNVPDPPKESLRRIESIRITRRNSDIKNALICSTSEVKEEELVKKLRDSSKKSSLKNTDKNLESKDVAKSASCDVIIVKEEFPPKGVKNRSLKNNLDKTLPAKDQGDSKSHCSTNKMKDNSPNQVDNEFPHISLTNPSNRSKPVKNNKSQSKPSLKLDEHLKIHQEVENKTKAALSLSSLTKPSTLFNRNSKKSRTDMFVDSVHDLQEQSSSDSTITRKSPSTFSKRNSKKSGTDMFLDSIDNLEKPNSSDSFTTQSPSKLFKRNSKKPFGDMFVDSIDDLRKPNSSDSNTTQSPSKLFKRNSKKAHTDMFVDSIHDLEKPKSSDSITTQSVSSISSKEPKSNSLSVSRKHNESITDLKTSKPLPGAGKTSKVPKENARISTDSPVESSEFFLPKKEKDRKAKAATDSSETSLHKDKYGKSIDSDKISKLLRGNPKKTQTSYLEATKPSKRLNEDIKPTKPAEEDIKPLKKDIKPSKPLLEDIENSPDSSLSSSNKTSESSKGMHTSLQADRIPSKLSRRKVDDLVAAVSSLVESEKESKLLENDKKTIAAHSLLELGNSPQFLKVGSVTTSMQRSPKSEVVDRTSPSSKSVSNIYITSSTDSTTPVDSWKLFRKENPGATDCIGVSCNNSREYDKPVSMNVPFTYSATNYEKPGIVNSSSPYRNPEKYVKQVAVNKPYFHRDSENSEKHSSQYDPFNFRKSDSYMKQVTMNTPRIYRNSENYEIPIATNTPFIYTGNHDKSTTANSPPLRNSARLRKGRDKRRSVVKLESIVESDRSESLSIPPFARRNSHLRVTNDSKPVSDSSDSTEPCARKPCYSDHLNPSDIRKRRSRPRMFYRSPTNLSPVKSCSELSDSEPQVVLTKLPDVHGNSKDGSVSAEMVKLCEMTEEKSPVKSKRKYSAEKPPVLVSMNVVQERVSSPTSRSLSTSPPCIHSIEDTDLPVNLSTSSPSSEKKTLDKPTAIVSRLRSESEDSDCGLVIDLDRRTSIEERVPSPTLQSYDIIDGMKKASVAEDSTSFFSDHPVPSTSRNDTHRSAEEKEASHTLLELTRSVPPIGREENLSPAEPENLSPAEPENLSPAEPENLSPAEPENLSPAEPENLSPAEPENLSPAEPENLSPAEPENLSPVEPENLSPAELERRRRGRRAREVRERARDQSILRTLLSDTDIEPRPPQDRSRPGTDSSNISVDSKDSLSQGISQLLSWCDGDPSSQSASIDDRFPFGRQIFV